MPVNRVGGEELQPLLTVDSLSAGYAGGPVVWDVALRVDHGEIVALLGPNGAGKSTTLLAISGFVRRHAGTVTFMGGDVTAEAPHRIARRGLVHVPEGRALIPSLTVAENLRLPRRPNQDAFELFPELKPLSNRRAALLSGGEQQMLAIARAVIMAPKLLLVDELSLGLAPALVQRLLLALRELATERKMGILLVEQHVSQALSVVDRAYILAHGRIQTAGTAENLRRDRALIASSYLGDRVGAADALQPDDAGEWTGV